MTHEREFETLAIDGHEVRVTHPEKLYFSRQVRLSKLDLVRYYLAVAPGALAGIRDRPIVLKRFVNGAEGEAFYQKRAPSDRPAFTRTVTLSFPSGRTAEELVVDDPAGLAWIVNLGCIELHPHAVRTRDLDHPDELRIDLDPGPGVAWDDVRRVAHEVRAVLDDMGLQGWPKTSGSRGMHVNVRIHPRWTFTEVRRAALALSREVERRLPQHASSKWWKEERHGVFLDYNQNAKDRTTASAYSVRPLPDARVSAPLRWDEVSTCDPAEFTVATMPARFADIGDPHTEMDNTPGSLDKLLELAARDEASGLGDAPWPPHFRKMEGEAARVAPSRAKSKSAPKPKSRARSKSAASDATDSSAESSTAATSESATARSSEPNPSSNFEPAADPTSETTFPSADEPPATAPSAASAESPSASESSTDPATASVAAKPRGRRQTMPLLTIANSPSEAAALAGLDRWKARYEEAAKLLAIDDVLIDRMRGSSSTWTRIRVNLRHVPEPLRPPQETPDPDDDPTRKWRQPPPG